MSQKIKYHGFNVDQKLNQHLVTGHAEIHNLPSHLKLGLVSTGVIELDSKLELRPSTDEEKLNKTEKRYLEYLRRLNPPWIGIQKITLKLADDTRLTPDFNYLDPTGRMVFVDVKGFQREDALIKMKVAARMFSWATFIIAKEIKNGWQEKEVKP